MSQVSRQQAATLPVWPAWPHLAQLEVLPVWRQVQAMTVWPVLLLPQAPPTARLPARRLVTATASLAVFLQRIYSATGARSQRRGQAVGLRLAALECGAAAAARRPGVQPER